MASLEYELDEILTTFLAETEEREVKFVDRGTIDLVGFPRSEERVRLRPGRCAGGR